MLSFCGTNSNKALHGDLDSLISHNCMNFESLLRCREPFGCSDGSFLTFFCTFVDGLMV